VGATIAEKSLVVPAGVADRWREAGPFLSLPANLPIRPRQPFRLPVAAPDFDGNGERYVVEALRSSWVSPTGSFATRFEREFAEACGTRVAIPVSNGTVALHLALLALDVRPGDEVIAPSLTFVSTANACVHAGTRRFSRTWSRRPGVSIPAA